MISKTLVRDIPLNPEKNFQKLGALSVNNYKFSIVYSIRARAIKCLVIELSRRGNRVVRRGNRVVRNCNKVSVEKYYLK